MNVTNACRARASGSDTGTSTTCAPTISLAFQPNPLFDPYIWIIVTGALAGVLWHWRQGERRYHFRAELVLDLGLQQRRDPFIRVAAHRQRAVDHQLRAFVHLLLGVPLHQAPRNATRHDDDDREQGDEDKIEFGE